MKKQESRQKSTQKSMQKTMQEFRECKSCKKTLPLASFYVTVGGCRRHKCKTCFSTGVVQSADKIAKRNYARRHYTRNKMKILMQRSLARSFARTQKRLELEAK